MTRDEAIAVSEPNMIPIKLEKKYPESKGEDITDAFLQGYIKGKADRPEGEWIFNPTDAIDLMFAKPKCSKCGFESSDGGNFCPNCGARMGKESEE